MVELLKQQMELEMLEEIQLLVHYLQLMVVDQEVEMDKMEEQEQDKWEQEQLEQTQQQRVELLLVVHQE
jgi:hypothetical protein